jgi:hypothetical protein
MVCYPLFQSRKWFDLLGGQLRRAILLHRGLVRNVAGELLDQVRFVVRVKLRVVAATR